MPDTTPAPAQKPPARPFSFRNGNIGVKWCCLLALSVAFTVPLHAMHLPAAILIGPMFAAVALAVNEAHLPIPGPAFLLAQGIVGCMIACSLQVRIFSKVIGEGPLFLGGVMCVIVLCTLIGFCLARWKVLPGSTALWGASPGAATVMTLMSQAYGADMRLVAFMQYFRAAAVAIATTTMARSTTPVTTADGASAFWAMPASWPAFGETIGVIVIGVCLAHVVRLSAGALMLPLIIATGLQDMGLLSIELPPWFLAAGYAVLGWGIGLRFTRATLHYAARALPYILMAIALMIAGCGAMALVLARFKHVSLLTAYLATSPGGEDTVAIIAATTPGVDMPFVMAMQTVRFVLVLFTGPLLARTLSRWVER
ncbi:AbrB family transcriptional regulator [Komagataeibacter sucrofermentans]|uniref:Ammonia monooxygenase n=1 Tax=Komagataeibacter sucrofermentans TaxID=1053551 RepID=A0A318QLA0_9PROT|nr:AbrB family transcriptional regulator [Komagataeibacter sucrofermentans]PYD79825.1 ammonia monooxygenase [Komagataeibacter sucrofermentans]